MKILKFGGSSVGDAERINSVINILSDYLRRKENIAVVFSAFQEVTDKLIEIGNLALDKNQKYLDQLDQLKRRHIETINQLNPQSESDNIQSMVDKLFSELSEICHGVFLIKDLSPRTMDCILSFGERLSNIIISETIKNRGIECEYLDARTLIKTDDKFGSAKVDFSVTNKNIRKHFNCHEKTQIITGFISSTDKNETTTLGRGGSDYTASIFGAAIGAEEIQIWTDVDGILSADPRKVKNIHSLKAVTYQEAMELSHFGAKVIYAPTLQPVLQNNIKIRIKNSLNPSFRGTVILEKEKSIPFNLKGISSIDEITLIRVQGSGMVGVTGIAARLFGALAKRGINIILISQASSEHSICFAVLPQSGENAQDAIKEEFKLEIFEGRIGEIIVEENLSIIAVVGEDLIQTPGVSGKVFESLGKSKINIRAIAQGSSLLNISLVIDKESLTKALNVLHDSLFVSEKCT